MGGLGLSVVAWVAERHGGGVRLLAPARGAEFEVTLPMADTAERAAASRDGGPVSTGR